MVDVNVSPRIRVVVNYKHPLKRMIDDAKFGWVNEEINNVSFSIMGEGRKKIYIFLLRFDEDMETEGVIRWMRKMHYRPARIGEILALAKNKPKLGLEFDVVALGAKCKSSGFRDCVVRIFSSDSGRSFGLSGFQSLWRGNEAFAAVPTNS